MKPACEVGRHGAHHLELELHYPLERGEDRANYRVDVFLFTPVALGLSHDRYGVPGFLHDIKSYTRCGLCPMPLAKLLDPACAISPLVRINGLLRAMNTAHDLDAGRVIYEFKTLVNLHHDEVRALRGLYRRQSGAGMPLSGRRVFLADYVRDHRAFVAAIRAYYPQLVDPRIPEEIRQALRLADEGISVKAEKELHHQAELAEAAGDMPDLLADLLACIAEEQEHRRRMGFASVAGPDFSEQNELYVYRESNLKKWAQSATYLTSEMAKTTARLSHLVASVAAALAMAFAVLAAVVTQMFYDMNSLPWAILIVASYMLKDRIKETVRNALINLVPTLVADRVVRLTDPRGGGDVGRSRERVRFFDSGSAPTEVRRMREHQSDSFRAILPPEQVIQFSKVLLLKSARLLGNHQRVASLHEIIRVNLSSWLNQMDDPVDELFTLCDGVRGVVMARRVYHVNLVVRLASPGDEVAPVLFKHRVILTREGITRVEHIG